MKSKRKDFFLVEYGSALLSYTVVMHIEISLCLLRGVVVCLTQTDVLSTSQTEVCVKTYDSSRGLSSGASSPFVKSRMDSVSLHCARQNGLSGAWQREGFFFFFALWALDPVLSIPLPALLAASQLVAMATGPGQHLKTIWFLMRIYFAQMVGKFGVGEREEKGEKRKEGRNEAPGSCILVMYF